MLQGSEYDKEALVELLREQKQNPAPLELEPVPEAAPKAPLNFASNMVPESPYKRLLACIESKSDLSIIKNMEEMGSEMSRLKQVSEDFIRGTMGLFNLPSRDNTAKYQNALINCLRHLFLAYSSRDLMMHASLTTQMTDSRLLWAADTVHVHPILFPLLMTIVKKRLSVLFSWTLPYSFSHLDSDSHPKN
jgi:hypothetical protein